MISLNYFQVKFITTSVSRQTKILSKEERKKERKKERKNPLERKKESIREKERKKDRKTERKILSSFIDNRMIGILNEVLRKIFASEY